MTNQLTEHQQKVLKAFTKKNHDIDLMVIYHRVYGDPGVLTARECQQKLAPSFSAVNAKIAPSVIEPGEIKRTYRLSTRRG